MHEYTAQLIAPASAFIVCFVPSSSCDLKYFSTTVILAIISALWDFDF